MIDCRKVLLQVLSDSTKCSSIKKTVVTDIDDDSILSDAIARPTDRLNVNIAERVLVRRQLQRLAATNRAN